MSISDSPKCIQIRVTRYGDSPIIINDETKQITLIKQDTQSEQVVYKVYELNSNGTVNVAFPTNKSDGAFRLKVSSSKINWKFRMNRALTFRFGQ